MNHFPTLSKLERSRMPDDLELMSRKAIRQCKHQLVNRRTITNPLDSVNISKKTKETMF